MNDLKTNFLNAKGELVIQKRELQKQLKEYKSAKLAEKNVEIKNMTSNNVSQTEIDSKKREYDYIISKKQDEFFEKINVLNSKIQEYKNDYLETIATAWETSNKEKLDLQKDDFEIKKAKKIASLKNKEMLCETKINKKLEALDEKIKDLKTQQVELETLVLTNLSTTQKEWDKEYIIETDGQKIIHCKKAIRKLKGQKRDLVDNQELKLEKLKAKNKLIIEKIDQKRERKYSFTKPFTKKWFSGQVLNEINSGIAKLDNQRHFYALKMGLIYLMPLTLVAAFWILLNSVILSTSNGGLLYAFGVKETTGLTNFKSIGGLVNSMTLGMMGIVLAGGIASVLGDKYNQGKIVSAIVGITCFISLVPMYAGKIGDLESTFVNFADLGSGSMFLAIFTGLVSIELYNVFIKTKWMKIKMPNGIPPAVAKSFNILIPYLFTTFIFAASSFSLLYFSGHNLNELLAIAIQKPLSSGIESVGGIILIRLICDGLWVLGIHGTNMIGPVVSPIYVQHLTENMNAVNAGLRPEWIVTSTFFDSYTLCNMAMIPLITIFVFSKRKDYLAIFAVAIVPSLFNISEPAIFGLPILLNPILAIPLVLGTLTMALVGYFATLWGMATPLFVMTPWTTPPIIGPFIASGGDINTLFLALILFGIGFGVYTPFVLVSNKQAMQYSPELIIARFTKKSRKMLINKEASEHILALEKKNKLKDAPKA